MCVCVCVRMPVCGGVLVCGILGVTPAIILAQLPEHQHVFWKLIGLTILFCDFNSGVECCGNMWTTRMLLGLFLDIVLPLSDLRLLKSGNGFLQ